MWAKIKSWLRIGRSMSSLRSAIRGLNSKRSNMKSRMRRVSLAITVYLIWEERNRWVFDAQSREVDSVFRRFQILFYIVFHFHEKNHQQLAVGCPFGGWLRGSSFACRSLTSVCCRQPPVVWFSAWFMYRFSWPSLLSFFGWYCMALVRACMVYCFMHAISRAVACCLAHHLGFVFVLFFFCVWSFF